jgi:hypothetical protein
VAGPGPPGVLGPQRDTPLLSAIAGLIAHDIPASGLGHGNDTSGSIVSEPSLGVAAGSAHEGPGLSGGSLVALSRATDAAFVGGLVPRHPGTKLTDAATGLPTRLDAALVDQFFTSADPAAESFSFAGRF